MLNHMNHCNKSKEDEYQNQVNDIVTYLQRELFGHKVNVYHRDYWVLPFINAKILINEEPCTSYPQVEVQILHRHTLNFDVVLTMLVTSIGTLDKCLRVILPSSSFVPQDRPAPISINECADVDSQPTRIDMVDDAATLKRKKD